MTVNDYKEAACATAGPVEEDMDTLELQPQKPPPPDNENLLGRVLAEFDGTTVLCRVCGDKASGFHYGVHSCEGCKGFFRRSIQQKIQYRPCTKNQQCTIQRINRNRCQYCRLRKCISVGMSRDAVRFGRVPKREKARILAAMQQSSHSRTLEKVVATELEDEHRLLATVIAAHHDTCDFTKDKVEPMLARAREQPSYIACPPTLACPLNPSPHPVIGQNEMLQDFSKRFSPAIRGVVEFAKRIPGFNLLAQDDQVTLLKAGVFEVLLVRLACMFDTATASMICLNGQVLKRESLQNSANARFLMDSMFDFADRINAMHLSDSEIALFCSVVVIAPDRPGLRNVELIEKMQNKLKAALQIVVSQNHHSQAHILDDLIKKVPDLRTLNTLHSEKLLAYKMTEQQQMMQQQQQQQQYQMWTNSPQPQREDQDCNSKSPTGSSWSPSSDSIEDAKSPQGSVSSTESMGSPEITSLNDFHHQNGGGSHHNNHHNNHPNHNNHQNHISANVANAPLLAATLAGGFCPHRHRANSGSASSGDDDLPATSHLIHNGLTITPVSRPHNINNNNSNINVHMRFRKLDSPSDSGIESGTEKVEKHSAPTSICSSPRPSMDDHQQHIVEDMPVLKRVLQAPPLWDTNSLMDEAYKPHKKFRVGLRNKDSAEAEPMQSTSPQPPPVNTVVPSQLQMQLTAPSPPQSSLSSTHSTLAKSLMEGPRMTAEQMQRTNIIHHFIMRDEHAATTVVSSPMVTASPTSCPYKMTGNGLQHQQPPSWATSVITTTGRHHLHPNGSPPLTHHQLQQAAADFNGRLSFVHHPQSPHSTSPAPPQTRSPTFSSPHSTLLSPLCHNNNTKVTELQVEVVDFQQPLNLSKKSPSPPPRSMKVVKMEV